MTVFRSDYIPELGTESHNSGQALLGEVLSLLRQMEVDLKFPPNAVMQRTAVLWIRSWVWALEVQRLGEACTDDTKAMLVKWKNEYAQRLSAGAIQPWQAFLWNELGAQGGREIEISADLCLAQPSSQRSEGANNNGPIPKVPDVSAPMQDASCPTWRIERPQSLNRLNIGEEDWAVWVGLYLRLVRATQSPKVPDTWALWPLYRWATIVRASAEAPRILSDTRWRQLTALKFPFEEKSEINDMRVGTLELYAKELSRGHTLHLALELAQKPGWPFISDPPQTSVAASQTRATQAQAGSEPKERRPQLSTQTSAPTSQRYRPTQTKATSEQKEHRPQISKAAWAAGGTFARCPSCGQFETTETKRSAEFYYFRGYCSIECVETRFKESTVTRWLNAWKNHIEESKVKPTARWKACVVCGKQETVLNFRTKTYEYLRGCCDRSCAAKKYGQWECNRMIVRLRAYALEAGNADLESDFHCGQPFTWESRNLPKTNGRRRGHGPGEHSWTYDTINRDGELSPEMQRLRSAAKGGGPGGRFGAQGAGFVLSRGEDSEVHLAERQMRWGDRAPAAWLFESRVPSGETVEEFKARGGVIRHIPEGKLGPYGRQGANSMARAEAKIRRNKVLREILIADRLKQQLACATTKAIAPTNTKQESNLDDSFGSETHLDLNILNLLKDVFRNLG